MFKFNKIKLKISSKVALSFIILVLLQGTVSLITLTLIISRTQNDSFQTQMNRAILSIEGYLQEILDAQMINAELLAGQTKVIDYTDFGLKNLLCRELNVYRSSLQMDSLAVYLSSEETFVTVGDELIGSSKIEEHLKLSLQGERTFFVTSGINDIKLSVLNPIMRDGKIIGVLSLIRSLNRSFVQRLETITHTRIVLLFENRTVSAGNLNPQTINKIIAAARVEIMPDKIMKIDSFEIGSVSMESLREPGGRIYCILDTTEFSRLITRYNVISLISTFLILSLALLVGIIFYRITFSRPFQHLLKGVYKISEGDLHYNFRVIAEDEFGDLAKAFNKMRVNLLNREQELLQLSLYNTLILENVPTGIITVNLRKKVTTFNPAAAEILEVDPNTLKGSKITSGLLPQPLFQLIGKSLNKNHHEAGREVIIGADRQKKILSLSISPLLSKDGKKIGMIVIFENITRVKQLEEKLSISSRLAALGEMAAGVAHQIRNPLGVMKVSAELLRDDFQVIANDATYNRLTHMMINEIDTLNLVIRNLLDFARPREIQKNYCSISEVIRYSLDSLPLDKYPNLKIETLYLENTVGYLMDKSLIEQVISNLVINAIQASTSDGKIQIKVSRKEERLQIDVKDWGCGFDESVRKQIFNPFFTTKSTGTGLGLSISHRIIEQHGGTIDVFSEPGKGSLFRITL